MARRRGREEPQDAGIDPGPAANPESVARTIVLNKLSAQARSRHELAEALAAKDVPEAAATAVLDRFEAVGLIDDSAFAAAWVESRQRTRGLARRALTQELRRKGVDDEVIRDSVDRIDDGREREIARALVDRKVAATRSLDRDKRFRRLIGLLARKGYSGGVAVTVVREALAEDERLAGSDYPDSLDDVLVEDVG